MPEEPSVLDYLKSKLKFWERGGKVEIPAGPEPPQAGSPEAPEPVEMKPAVLQSVPKPVTEPPPKKIARPTHWPWRSLLALILALLGQRAWEPVQDRTAGIGLVFYALSLALLVWAYFSQEWTLTPVPETGFGSDAIRVRRLPLILGIPLALAAFITLGHNLFTNLEFPALGSCHYLLRLGFLAAKRRYPSILAPGQDFLRTRCLADQGHTLDIARVGRGGGRRILPHL